LEGIFGLLAVIFSPGLAVKKERQMPAEDRNFIGIGKIFIDTPAEDWNIPNLHFIVSESADKIYEAVNLEFGLVAIGESDIDSVSGLVTLASSYILSVIKDGNGYKELREIARKSFMSDYWAEYRGIEFDLAETGDDLSHYIDKNINKAIRESFNDEIKKALEQGAKRVADEIISLLSMRPPVVEYKAIHKGRTAA
jgi:hypothetical protein